MCVPMTGNNNRGHTCVNRGHTCVSPVIITNNRGHTHVSPVIENRYTQLEEDNFHVNSDVCVPCQLCPQSVVCLHSLCIIVVIH